MASATEIIEKVTKTVTVDERTGVTLMLTQDEADYLAAILGSLPGRHSDYKEAGRLNQNIYDALSKYTDAPWTKWDITGDLGIVLKGS